MMRLAHRGRRAESLVTVLIIGGGGMLGHALWQASRESFQTFVTMRGEGTGVARRIGAGPAEVLSGVDVVDFDTVVRAFAVTRPDAVVNCAGIVKQRPEAGDPIRSLAVNALFPHRLAGLCRACGARLVHISTDCVFSGRDGGYRETDPPDAEDLYGRSKLLGEVGGPGAVTLRTSMIGRELSGGLGLVEWFLAQPGPEVPGYVHARFSGLTTAALSRVILDVLARHTALEGLHHVAAEPISKYGLLRLLAEAFGRQVAIRPMEEPHVDRTLDGARFRQATGWVPPDWPSMIEELARGRTASRAPEGPRP
jgi:dTDP-4-dehydrorhamnose reductase